MNDVWRSTDNGATWTQMNASAGWSTRSGHSSVAMPDGSIVLMGGNGGGMSLKNDVWRVSPVGSSVQNPSHTYTIPGIYNVALHVYNAQGYNSTLKTGYIAVMNMKTQIGIYQNGIWYLDYDGSVHGMPETKHIISELPGWTTIVGDWNETGKSYIGVTNGQQWYLDWNGNGAWDAGIDKAYSFGAPGWTTIVGDWNGTGKSYIGVTNGQQWYLDWNGNGAWDAGIDKAYSFGAPGWTTIVGDWNGTGKSSIGVTNGQQWYLDWNGNGAWDAGIDKAYSFGAPGWTTIVGDWNGTGKSSIGVTNGQQWYLDWNGNGAWDAGIDKAYSFGAPGWTTIVGDWNGDRKAKIGISNGQQWYLDSNGNGAWDICSDHVYSFEAPGGIPIVGVWETTTTESRGITCISPTSTSGNDILMSITGSEFQQGFTAKMTKSANTNIIIVARDVRWDSPTQVIAWFTIPTPRQTGNV